MTDDRLVLWGVEGVLVADENALAAAIADACTRLAGKPCTVAENVTDHPDLAAVREILRAEGIEGPRLDELVAEAPQALAESMSAGHRREEIVTAGRTPGSAEALAQLRHRQEAPQSLFTGRIEANAAVAVGAVGLERYLDLEVGGYGSDAEDRTALPAIVHAKVRDKYGAVPATTVLVTGSFPDTVAAAAENIRVIGVTADPRRAEELRDAGARAVLPDLSSTTTVLEAIYAEHERQ
jgi:phosphoglycolate phosphatase